MSRFVKDSVTLLSGNAWAQAIGLLAYPVITRLYTPTDFGLFNIFYSYIEVLIILSTGKYEMGVVAAQKESEAVALSSLAFKLNTWLSLLLLTALLIIVLLSHGQAVQPLGYLALLIPPMVFCQGTSRIYAALLNRKQIFRSIALSEVVNASLTAGLKILFGILKGLWRACSTLLGTFGQPVGAVIGKLGGNVIYIASLKRNGISIHKQEKGSLKEVAKRFINFPLYTMPKEFLNSFSYNLPIMWLAYYFDSAEIGLYGLALMLVFRPAQVVNSSFERTLYSNIAQKVNSGQSINHTVVRFVSRIGLVGCMLSVIAFFVAEPVMGFVFGSDWRGCGYYVRSLLPWFIASTCATPLTCVANVFSRQRGEFLFYVALFALRVGSMIVAIKVDSFRMGVLLFSLSGALVMLSSLAWYYSIVRRYERSLK